MRLSLVLNSPPKFHFWKDFGAGKKRRIPYYKQWRNIYRNEINRKKVTHCTLPIERLPTGSRVLDAEDFMQGHIGAMPDELIKLKEEKIVYDHPWPFNVKLDPIKQQQLMHCYTINTRFFVPRDDCQVLTNTILETNQLKANPPIEPTEEHIVTIQRQYDWCTKGDSVMVRLPRQREFPKINIKPKSKFGLTKERQEVNVMSSMFDFSQTMLAQYYHRQEDQERLRELLCRRSIAFPRCQAPFQRQDNNINMNLCIDYMSISGSPLPKIDSQPQKTRDREPIDIRPRSWKSLLEKSKQYTPDWTFTMPRNTYLHTIQLASRIKRDHGNEDEMLARSMVHAFGLANQYARLRAHEQHIAKNRSDDSKQASVILQDPLSVANTQLNDKDLLDEPIVLQTIGFELPLGNFHFMRYQLNTANFDDTNESRVKNQAWYSGPINDINDALRYYLDFQAFGASVAKRSTMVSSESNQQQQTRLVNNQSV